MSNTSPGARPKRPFLRRPVVLVGLVVVVIVAAAGAYWFQPWKLLTNTTVNEALPTMSAPPSAGNPGSPQAPRVLAEGTFVSHEHDTSGTAQLLALPDGSAVVRLENLDTSDGPKLRVLLTDASVIAGKDGWHVFENGRHYDLGALKGNRGSANYSVPDDVDVTGLTSVSIWCDRFDVSFGSAVLLAPSRG